MKTIRQTIIEKQKNVLNVYFTAGHPTLESTEIIIRLLAQNGVDLVEIGMPYSDPLADGPTIQKSSETALKNGQTIAHVFKQVKNAKKLTDIPIILMGYFNQILQYGPEKFIEDAKLAGIQGLIIPDMPMEIYESMYMPLFKKFDMEISFLVTPLTSELRIRKADALSTAFVYVVSQSGITGKQGDLTESQKEWFDRIRNMELKSPVLTGFGIHDQASRQTASAYCNGVIVGSAFIRALEENAPLESAISRFIQSLEIS